ncbi:MAG TPA: dihydroorotase [Flavitalea sp.]|nr:dihydroorotase [Flavitalea sp.]
MKVLIQQAHIIDPASPFNGSRQDIFIDSGVIRNIGASFSEKADHILSGAGLVVSPGWVDIFANFADPGFEFKETLKTGATAAAAGGFTDVFVIPNTRPVIDTKSQVEYLRKPTGVPVNIHPIGAVSRNAEGKDLAEMYDMHNSGALSFSDGLNPIQSAGLLLKALQYVKAFNGVIIQIPDDKSVGANGLIHEGIISTRLGLPGKPLIAEELLVSRDIELLKYAGSKIHFTGVTSPRSLEYIKKAKDEGLNVTCSVAPYHLYFTDEDLMGYNTYLKVYPPLRTKQERQFLWDAVADGTIDCIATHHMPHEYDSKILEFEYAKNGMIGLETCYAALKSVLPAIPDTRWVELLSLTPRKIFGLTQPAIKENEPACITLFSPDEKIVVDESFFRSRAKNSPFTGKTLTGKVMGIIQQDNLFLR